MVMRRIKFLQTSFLVILGAAVAGAIEPPPGGPTRTPQEPRAVPKDGGPPTKKAAKPRVTSIPSPNKDGRGGAKIDTIVMHHTAGGGTAQDVGNGFKDPGRDVSSHYVVDKAGTIVQCVEDKDRSWHAGKSEFKGRADVNDFSIGIEMVNRGDNKDPYTDAQYEALGKLVAFLQDAYDVPRDRVTGHKDIALPKGRKIDPAPNFSYERLFKEVAKARGE